MNRSDNSQEKLRVGIAQGNVKRALKSLNGEIKRSPRESLLYRERAHLYLYSGQAQLARADFDATARLSEGRAKPGRLWSNGEYDAIGVTYWMQGHRDLALAFWRYTTRRLFENRVSYAQMGGGIESAQLLWFGAVHERTPEDMDLIQKFYEKRLASKFWSHDLSSWPGPLVQFFLKNIDDQTLLEKAEDGDQQLCEAHFAIAIRSRELCRYAEYRKRLKLVVPRDEPKEIYEYYNVLPYFLARFELEKAGR